MAIRTFLFCDTCNPQATRSVEQRRDSWRGDKGGRRLSDNRAWIEGSIEEAVREHGWHETPDGHHICPACQARRRIAPHRAA